MGEPIRTWLFGPQSGGAEAATYYNMYFEGEATHKPDSAHVIPPIHNGTVIQDQFSIPTTLSSDLGPFKLPIFFDQFGYVLTTLCGPPATTPDWDGATGVFQHIWKLGPSTAPNLASHQVYDGVLWEKAINHALATCNFTGGAVDVPYAEVAFMGSFAAQEDAPTLPDTTVADYNHPIGPRLIAVLVNGGAYSDLISWKLNVNNARTKFWTAVTNADVRRVKRGFCTADFDIAADILEYSGSFYQNYVEGTSPGMVAVSYIDTGTLIGGGSPTYPQFRVDMPKPGILTGDRPPVNDEATQHITGKALYSPDDATSIYFTLVNEVPHEDYVGS